MKTAAVAEHYGSAGIAERVLAALREAKGPDAPVTPDNLAPFDHFHGRGVVATQEIAAQLALTPGERVLDIGSGIGGPAITAKTADLFPGRQLGTILGVITIGSGVGSAVGSWGAGWIYDLSGSYRVAFIASIVSYAAGVIAFWALRRPPARTR